jgi:FMN phosphatase YigB (HAD superfamily)
MSYAGKLIVFDFDETIAKTWNPFNPFRFTWRPLPGAVRFREYYHRFPDRTYILTARLEWFEGRAMLQRYLQSIGITDFPDPQIICAGFLRNFHKEKARIIRELILTFHPSKVVLFDDKKANRDMVEIVEDEFPHVNIVVVDPVNGHLVGRATPEIDD